MDHASRGRLPVVTISRRGADCLRAGHVWVYRSDVRTASEFVMRRRSPRTVNDLEQLVRERIRAAIAYRERFVRNTNAYRVIFSEGDFLPGLIVDRYNDILSLQVLTQAMDAEPMRQVFLSELQDALHPTTIFE